MPRRLIKSYLPDHRSIRDHKSLRFLGARLHHPGLWHLSRRSVSGALAVGVFIAFIPTPGQMVLAALASLWLRINLPLAVATVWITNPVTMPPMYYFSYRVGAWLLNSEPIDFKLKLSLEWLSYNMNVIWQPLLLGSLIVGLLLALSTYVVVSTAWRWHIIHIRRRRKPNNRTIDKPRSSST